MNLAQSSRSILAGMALLAAGAAALALHVRPPAQSRSSVVVAVMLSGVGPDELAALGCSGEDAASTLEACRGDHALLAAIESSLAQISSLDREIRDLKAAMRESPSSSRELRSRLAEAESARIEAGTRLAELREDLRTEIFSGVATNQMVAERIVCSLPASRALPAPWRANTNSPARKAVIAEALAERHVAESQRRPAPPEAVIILAEEQARPDTANAVSRHSANAEAVGSVFLTWIRSSER